MFLIVNNDHMSQCNDRNSNNDSQCIENALKKLGQNGKIVDSNCAINLTELRNFQGILLSGGPWDLTKPLLFGSFKLDIQVMINANVPIYGICMGHQIMAEANGANIGRWPTIYHGEREIEILDHNGLFEGIPDKISMVEWHQEFVMESPPGFELTATSAELYSPFPPISINNDPEPPSPVKGCKVQALQHKDKKMYSTQFHPELSGEIGLKILNNFVKLCS